MPDFELNQAAMPETPLGQIREFVRDPGPVEMELRKDLEAKLIARVRPLSALQPQPRALADPVKAMRRSGNFNSSQMWLRAA
ncbi:hypothetical protein R3X27_23735 [Tropicimonas sp. TH_r6]|uniref:hypothetical protein n=1 Tax=Tropicimonas sp. TH_r6 TaxID=3082085 RepID=UPI0029558FC5|nr:hypothetical protein [Tropicimonas sp. TH_r6]MDV7145704.1 hypothetical protein [Tropicimonas sp. TH_r6]